MGGETRAGAGTEFERPRSWKEREEKKKQELEGRREGVAGEGCQHI